VDDRIVDVDTIKVNIDVGFGLDYRGTKGKGITLRFNNYNAPESRGNEAELGKQATAQYWYSWSLFYRASNIFSQPWVGCLLGW